jgi:enoyl-CoA hydratase
MRANPLAATSKGSGVGLSAGAYGTVARVSDDPTSLVRDTTEAGAEFAVLTFDHGPLNLFDQQMFDVLAANIADLTANTPRAVLLRAEGSVNSAGVDVHVFQHKTAQQGADLWRTLFTGIIHPLEALVCPVVFSAHGLTLTAAFEIALACDIVLASPKAKFGLVEAVVGLTPSMGGPQRLAERAGSGQARELVMTGDLYDAATLKDWGVVNAVHGDVDAAARALTSRLADGPTKAHAATKTIVSAWRSGGVAHADSITPDVSGALFDTADLRSAVTSFLETGPGHASYFGR